jgi:hypothetical protein
MERGRAANPGRGRAADRRDTAVVAAPEFEVSEVSDCFEAWSVTRLPFEPKNWLIDYRQALRNALKRLQAREGLGLSARYFAPDDDLADLENVLCYNVGSSSYAHLIGGGLQLDRDRSPDHLHRVSYRVRPITIGHAAPFATVTADIPSGTHSAGQWWALLRPLITVMPTASQVATFGVELELSGKWTNSAVASEVKPMLDGLISALHSHNQDDYDTLWQRLAPLGAPDDLSQLLRDTTCAVLGPRRLVRAHGPSGIAWNPADHLCTQIVVARGISYGQRSISAVVYAT